MQTKSKIPKTADSIRFGLPIKKHNNPLTNETTPSHSATKQIVNGSPQFLPNHCWFRTMLVNTIEQNKFSRNDQKLAMDNTVLIRGIRFST